MNTQQMICEAYGYKEPFHPTDEIFKFGKKNNKKITLVYENEEPCSMCGKVHPVGYASIEGTGHLLKTMIPNSYNKCYALLQSNFICEHCGYSLVTYGSPAKMKYGKKMINSLVDKDGYKEMHFNSDDKNELYALLKNPPKAPFIILINSGGTVVENLVYTAKPTLCEKWFVVNYGAENLEVSTDEVLECLHEARVIATKLGIKPSTEQLFNRQNDITHQPNRKLLENEEFLSLLGDFLEKYNRDCRIVSKMVLAAYLKEHKEPIVLPETNKQTVASQGLFDF